MAAALLPLSFCASLVSSAAGRSRRCRGAAAADEQAAVTKVTNLNRKALEAYNKQDYDTARALLKEALEVCASAGLDKHPIRARTHIHFGVVAIVGFKQREVGLKQFRKALEVQPDIKLTKTAGRRPSFRTPSRRPCWPARAAAAAGPRPAAASRGDAEGVAGNQAVDDGGDAGGPGRQTQATAAARRRATRTTTTMTRTTERAEGQPLLRPGPRHRLGPGDRGGRAPPRAPTSSEAAGFAMAQPGHVAPEVGFFVTRRPADLGPASLPVRHGLNGKPRRESPAAAPPTTSARRQRRGGRVRQGDLLAGQGRRSGSRWAARSAAATSATRSCSR